MKRVYRYMLGWLSTVTLLSLVLFCSTTMATPEKGDFFGTPDFDRANAIVSDGSGGYYLVGASNTQDGTHGWIRAHQHDRVIDTNYELPIQLPSSFSNTLLFDVLRLPDGDLIAVGSGLPKEQTSLPEPQQKEDGWVIRVTPEGRTIWSQIYSSVRHERFYFATARPDGTILVGGRSETNKHIGISNGVSYIIDSKSGKRLYRQMWGGESIRRCGFYDGITLPGGGYVLVGWATKPRSDKDNVWIVAANPDHSEHWSKTWGDAGDDLGYRVILDTNGYIAVFGWGTDKNNKYTSGMVIRLNQQGETLKTAFFEVGELGDDKFLSGIQRPNGEYIVVGEASTSPKKYRGKAWLVKLDPDFEKVDEKHFQIRGSRFLDLAAKRDNFVVATGYGIAPGNKQIDAWVSEIDVSKDNVLQKQIAKTDSWTQKDARKKQDALREGSRQRKTGESNRKQERMEGLEDVMERIQEQEKRLSPKSLFFLGKAAYDMGDYAAAFRSLQPAANDGHADAQYYLGVMYATGRGVPHDDAQGAKWYRRSAKQGHADAQYYLGTLYNKGAGVPRDYSIGVKWWQRAANQGHSAAQYSIGQLYLKGWLNMPRDFVMAYMWISLSAETGNYKASVEKGLLERVLPQEDLTRARKLKTMWKPRKEVRR